MTALSIVFEGHRRHPVGQITVLLHPVHQQFIEGKLIDAPKLPGGEAQRGHSSLGRLADAALRRVEKRGRRLLSTSLNVDPTSYADWRSWNSHDLSQWEEFLSNSAEREIFRKFERLAKERN